MKYAAIAAIIAVFYASSAAAQDYRAVTDQSEFLSLIANKNLTHRLYGIDIQVRPDGRIEGTGAGWEVTGTWRWEDGYFCREMTWGGDPIPYNCQLVEVSGDDLRFTVDKGAGRSAALTLR